MVNLEGQRILLFIPNGKGIYGSAVSKELETRGAQVFVYDERPSSSFLVKSVIRFGGSIFKKYFRKYFTRIINDHLLIRIDFIFIIRGEAFTPAIVNDFHRSFPTAKFILYLWDSINYTNTRKLIQHFDRVFSFDSEDVRKYPDLIHRPLFFIDDYREISEVKPDKYDIIFIGKIHSDRYRVLMKMKEICNSHNLRTFYYLYLPSKLHYILLKLFSSSLANSKITEFKFSMISSLEVADFIAKSKACIDTQHPLQSGLTMRTIETLGAKRKLITTNKYILGYDFYDKDNICLVNINNPIFDIEFLHSPYKDIDRNVYERYSLRGWIDEIFREE